jgi:hypothetical protein
MLNTINKDNRSRFPVIKIFLLFLSLALLNIIPVKSSSAEDGTVYKDGIYCYMITNEAENKVKLIGVECSDEKKELDIPGTVYLNDVNYTVEEVDFHWSYYENSKYNSFYDSVIKLNIADTFTGSLENPLYAFSNVRTIEFHGSVAPKKVEVYLWNGSENPDVLFIVPKDSEKVYANIIDISMEYYNGSDLYEMEIPMEPTIVSKVTDDIEYGCFNKNGFIYQVISSAKDGKGKVQLVGLTKQLHVTYLSLPEEITNNDCTYQLTKLCKFSLVNCGATVIDIPDTVTEMESSIFDYKVELLFLSKNCKVIPARMITDENNVSHLRFVSVPEGVTTISENAFFNQMQNEGSIILPNTIKSLGKKSIYSFKLVTFLNKKPIAGIVSAIKSGTTVKVNSTTKSTYRSALGDKVSVVSAKNVVKSTKLSVNKSSLTIGRLQTKTLKGTLKKGSNETVFWLSSNTDIFKISEKGTISPKKAGTAYAIAYTRTSGLHKSVKITVTDK